MAVFAVMYDLRNESGKHDYKPLWDELNRLGAFRTQLSVWLLSTNASEVTVHDHLKRFMDTDDRLMITRMFRDHYHYSGATKGTNDWAIIGLTNPT